MSGNIIDLAVEAAAAGNYPENRFNQRERKMLESVKEYVDNSPPNDVITTQGDLITGDVSGDAVRLAAGSANTLLKSDGTSLSYAKVSLENLDSGIAPAYFVAFAGKYSTLGGSATEAQTLSGVAASDVVIACLQDKGGTPRTLLTSKPTLNTITYVFSGDPSTDHVVSYQVLRAAT